MADTLDDIADHSSRPGRRYDRYRLNDLRVGGRFPYRPLPSSMTLFRGSFRLKAKAPLVSQPATPGTGPLSMMAEKWALPSPTNKLPVEV